MRETARAKTKGCYRCHRRVPVAARSCPGCGSKAFFHGKPLRPPSVDARRRA